jgi:membrane fusion protein (multidrug efflux system)
MSVSATPLSASLEDEAIVDTGAMPGGSKKKRARLVFAALALAVTAVWGGVSLHGFGKETTDDAQVEGHIVNVTPRVSGRVRKVLVRDNQLVAAGDVLVELETDETELLVDAAQAELAAAKAQLSAAKAHLAIVSAEAPATLQQARAGLAQATHGFDATHATRSRAEAELRAAEARLALATSDVERARTLAAQQAIPRTELEAKTAAFDAATAAVAAARAQLDSMQASMGATRGSVDVARGHIARAATAPQQVDAARASVDVAAAGVLRAGANLAQATLKRSFLQVKAPVRGIVSRRTVEVGQATAPDRAMMALVAVDDVWVVANFKEDQIVRMRAGQRARVHVDAYGGAALPAHVDSLAGASGARFALLPPDNASGNFVKVVQRVPVLLRIDGDTVRLRPGMSVFATVDTRGR